MYLDEVLRKAVHLGSIVFPVAAVLFERTPLVLALAAISLALLLFDYLKARNEPFKNLFMAVFGRMLRHREEQGGMTASTIVVASAALTILIFRTEIAVAALVFLSLGDSAAALVGRHCGRISLVSGRTLEGSLAAFNACLLASIGLMVLRPEMGWDLTPTALLAGSLAATLAELFDLPLDDNLRIPLAAGLVMELVVPG